MTKPAMNRYSLCGILGADMYLEPEGDWVRYADVKALLDRAEAVAKAARNWDKAEDAVIAMNEDCPSREAWFAVCLRLTRAEAALLAASKALKNKGTQ